MTHDIDWSDKAAKISEHFTVHEATWLPSFRCYHEPSEDEKFEIIALADVMEQVRELFNSPIQIHCWIRPLKVNAPGTKWHNKNYNRAIGSRATKSAHIFGQAVDFHVCGYSGATKCNEGRKKLLPYIAEFGVRMENLNGSWIHLDTYPVKNKRFFRP